MTDPSLASAGISRATAHASAAPTQDVTRGWQSELRELAIDCTKMAVGAAIAVVAFKLVAPYLNPFKQDEERAEAQRKMVEGRLGDRLAEIETDPYEIQIAANVVLPEDLDVGFSDIAGLDKVKQRLIEAVILPFSRPELFPKSRILGPPKGVLLYGPPGTGKTMLAKAIACETRATFIQMELSMLQNQWFGESQHLVKALFTLARKLEPSIIFVDEIDSFGRTRRDDDHQVAADMQAEFMSCWDGFASDAYRVMILVWASTKPFDAPHNMDWIRRAQPTGYGR